MKKRGQITVFIIIGILVLAGAAIFFFAREKAETAKYRPEISEVPVTMQPVSDYITTCIEQTAEIGLRKIGEHGGYIEPMMSINPVMPTQADAVQLGESTGPIIPYWWHLKSDNNCRVQDCRFAREQVPLSKTEHSIKAQLDRHIQNNLRTCLGNFEPFTKQGFEFAEKGALKANTVITQKNVFVELDYPLEIKRAEEIFEIDEFTAELDLGLYSIYHLASNITALQAESSFLENHARNLIDIFSRADKDALPPVSEMEFGFSNPKFWIKLEVEQKLREVLAAYVPFIQVQNTRNHRFIEAPADTKDPRLYEVLYNRGMLIPLPELNTDYNVRFVYLDWWKPYFDMNCNGQICQPEGFMNTFGVMFGVKRYAFAYDLSWPVLVEITSPDAFNGKGFTFRFFLEGNLRNNVPLAALEPETEIPAIKATTMLCSPRQKTGGKTEITVVNEFGKPVSDAEISFNCGTETCSIGITGEDGKLTANLPKCIGGILSAKTPEHYPAYLPLDTDEETERKATLELQRYYEVGFGARKYLLKKGLNWKPDLEKALAQTKTENTIIMLTRQAEDFEEPFSAVAEICGSAMNKAEIPCGSPPSDTSENVLLLPGTYDVKIYSFNYPAEPIKIMPEKRCWTYRKHFKKRKKCVCVPTKTIEFNQTSPLYSGYAEFEWTITKEELANARQIEFYYFNFALDRIPADEKEGCVKRRHSTIEDLEALGNIHAFSEQYSESIKPAIIK